MSKNAPLTAADLARLERYRRGQRNAQAERARLAATPTRAPKLTPVYMQGAYGDWEWLLADPEHCVLTRWRNRGLIEPYQYAAGMRLRSVHWRGGLAGLRAVDPTREPVDGGRSKDLSERQLDARAELNAVLRALNPMSARLAVDVAVLDRDGAELEREHRWRKGYGLLRVREALDDLAGFYGLANRRR